MNYRNLILATGLGFTSIFVSTAAFAQSGSAYKSCDDMGTHQASSGQSSHFSVDLAENDTLSFVSNGEITGPDYSTVSKTEAELNVRISGGDIRGFVEVSTSGTYTARTSSSYQVIIPRGQDVSISCAASISIDEISSAAKTSGAVQSSNIMGNVLRARSGGNGASGVEASRGGIFANLADTASGTRLWGYLDYSNYSQAGSGYSVGLTAGGDRQIGGLRAGVLVSLETSSIDLGSGNTDSDSFVVGPYVSGSLGFVDYDAYVSIGRAYYENDAGSQTGNRALYGVNLSGDVALGKVDLSPFLRLGGSTETFIESGALEADQVETQRLSLGTRISLPTTDTGATQYVSLGYDAVRSDSDVDGVSEYFAPRFGFGIDQVLDSGANFGVNVDAGEILEDVTQVSVGLSYSFNF